MSENKENYDEFENLREDIDTLGITDRAGFKNLMAVLEYSKVTRELFRELQKENELYKRQILDQGKKIDVLQQQLQSLLISSYSGGPTQTS